jgi:SEC-C motif-containing protein
MKPCPCGSKKLFATCCEPFLSGTKAPLSPLELMRSRFSAYVNQDVDYLLHTWDPSTRPKSVDMAQSPQWLDLQIIKSSCHGNCGVVEFKATYLRGNTIEVLHETSRFMLKQHHWFYVDGDLHEPQAGKPGRNSPCPCGSGAKFKKCCM